MQLKKLNMCFIEWMAILFIVFSVSLSLFFLNTNNGRNNSFSSQIHRLFWESVAWFLFRVTTFYAHSSSIRSFVRSYMHPFLFVLLQFSIVCVTDIAFSCEDFFAVLVFGSSISNHICWHCGNFSFLFVRLSTQPNRTALFHLFSFFCLLIITIYIIILDGMVEKRSLAFGYVKSSLRIHLCLYFIRIVQDCSFFVSQFNWATAHKYFEKFALSRWCDQNNTINRTKSDQFPFYCSFSIWNWHGSKANKKYFPL